MRPSRRTEPVRPPKPRAADSGTKAAGAGAKRTQSTRKGAKPAAAAAGSGSARPAVAEQTRPPSVDLPDFAERVYALTKLIPRGQVATYGQIATYVASPRFARAVGTALRNLPRSRHKDVPWQRVINASGRISARGEVERPDAQLRLLKKEGVVFDQNGQTNLAVFGWAGPIGSAKKPKG